MKWYHYLICFALIIIGIFSSINLVKLFNVSSSDYGTIYTVEVQNKLNNDTTS